jgi:hypothetical protein
VIRRIRKNLIKRESARWQLWQIALLIFLLLLFALFYGRRPLSIIGRETLTSQILDKKVVPSTISVCAAPTKQGCASWERVKTYSCQISIEGEQFHALQAVCDLVEVGSSATLVIRGVRTPFTEREVIEVVD